jgi:hypothetical protein
LLSAQRRIVKELVDANELDDERREVARNLTRGELSEAQNLDAGSLIANLANVNRVKFSNTGGHSLRIDDYVRLVVRTKVSHIATMGQRNGALKSGRDLIQVSNNVASTGSACNLFVGRVFALTSEASSLWGIPHVNELPNAGIPLHPNCNHRELVFFPELMDVRSADRVFTSPPEWALNSPWAAVQKQYTSLGGDAFASRNNPNLRFARDGEIDDERRLKSLMREARKRGLISGD